MTWEDWVRAHAATFGMAARPETAETLLRWSRLFQGGGFTPVEMAKATEAVALGDPPRYLDAHLRSLLDAARRERARLAAVRQEDARWVECHDCGGSGWVTVPSWKSFERRWGEAVCLCSCAYGARNGESWQGYAEQELRRGRRVALPTPLDAYEAGRADWRDRLKAQRAQRAAEAQALAEAGGLAGDVGKVVARVRKSAG